MNLQICPKSEFSAPEQFWILAKNPAPAFAWRTPDTLNLGVDVPLAHLHVEKGVLTQVPDLTVRRYARRQVRPHIATGVAFAIGRLIADGLTVNTSDAGFAGNPEYFARLDFVGNTALDALAQFGANSAYIASSDSKQFVYAAPELIKFLPGGLALPFAITWVGVEPVTGCEPVNPRATSRSPVSMSQPSNNSNSRGP